MKKQLISMTLALALTASSVLITPGNTESTKAAETPIAENTTITSIPLFKNAYDFRKYIDNADTDESSFTIQEQLSAEEDAKGGVHEFTAPETGTLIYYTFSDKDEAIAGRFYSDFNLTDEISESTQTTHLSTRSNAGTISVKKGTTYYFRQERLNYHTSVTATTYMGLIPTSTSAKYVTPTTNYAEETDTTVEEFDTVDEFKNDLSDMEGTTEYIINEPGTRSPVHSFSVNSSGWLLLYGYVSNGYIDLRVFSDKTLGSMIACTNMETMDEEPMSVWVEPGTYYFYSYRWNGYSDSVSQIPQISYFGFIDASQYITAGTPVLSSDKTSSTVTFTAPKVGSIRVMKSLPEPSIINDDDFWQVSTRTNMISGKTFTATENGDYVARFQDNATKMYYMVPFTVTGIVAKTSTGNDTNANTNTGTNTSTNKVSKPGKPTIKSVKNVKGKKAKVVLKKKVSGATGYQISYSTSKKFKKATTKKFKKTTITLKKLKKKKTYYIRVRAYNSAGKSSWSKTKKVKIKK